MNSATRSKHTKTANRPVARKFYTETGPELIKGGLKGAWKGVKGVGSAAKKTVQPGEAGIFSAGNKALQKVTGLPDDPNYGVLGTAGALGLGGLLVRDEYRAPYNQTARKLTQAKQRGETPMTSSYNQFVSRRKQGSASRPKQSKTAGIGKALMSGADWVGSNPGKAALATGGALAVDAAEDMISPVSQTAGQQISAGMFGPSAAAGVFPDAARQQAQARQMGQSMVSVPARTIGAATQELAQRAARGGAQQVKRMAMGPKHKRVLQKALQGDEQLQDLTPKERQLVQKSFETMKRFAPNLASDEFATRNFLRQSLLSASGPDYATIRNIADTNRQVTR